MRSAVTPSILRRREARTYFDAGSGVTPELGQCASVSAGVTSGAGLPGQGEAVDRLDVLVTQQ
jgi:hypothetical protein